MTNFYSTVNGLTVPDPAVKKQVLAELNAATNVRLNHDNMNTLIYTTILAQDLKLQYVGGMVTADSDACSFNVLGMLQSILGLLGVVADAGAIFKILQSIIGMAQAGASGGLDSVQAAYNELLGALGTQLNKLLAINGQIASTLLTDWGKLQRANALIIDGSLAWPPDDSAAVTAAANAYEIEVSC